MNILERLTYPELKFILNQPYLISKFSTHLNIPYTEGEQILGIMIHRAVTKCKDNLKALLEKVPGITDQILDNLINSGDIIANHALFADPDIATIVEDTFNLTNELTYLYVILQQQSDISRIKEIHELGIHCIATRGRLSTTLFLVRTHEDLSIYPHRLILTGDAFGRIILGPPREFNDA